MESPETEKIIHKDGVRCGIRCLIVYSLLTCAFSLFSIYLLNSLMRIFYALCVLTFLAVWINMFRYMRLSIKKSDKLPKCRSTVVRCTVHTVFFWVFFLIVAGIINIKTRAEIKNYLYEVDIDQVTIKMNNEALIEQKEKLIEAIKGIHRWGAKPASRDRIKCEITSPKGSLTLSIGKDPRPGCENVYWVYYPKYRVTKNNNVGIIYFDE